jgi:hypothetical protein
MAGSLGILEEPAGHKKSRQDLAAVRISCCNSQIERDPPAASELS